MDVAWGEGLAVACYERHNFDPSTPASAVKIANAVLGDGCIEVVPNMRKMSDMFTLRGRKRIAVRRKIGFFIAHEIGHHLLGEEGYQGEDEEEMANLVGAALLAPLPAVRSLVRAYGRMAFADIAQEVKSSQTWAALRIAEALHIPRAVLTPLKNYVRGPEEFVWGPEDDLRKLARSRRPGITKTRLTDSVGRLVIDVEEFESA